MSKMLHQSLICKLIFITFIFAICDQQVLGLNLTDECKEMGYGLEQDFRAFVLIEKKSIIPNTEKSLTQYCKRAKAIPKKMKQFKKCVNKVSQQIVNMIIPNLNKAIRKMCINERKDAVKNLQCLKPTHRPMIRKCFNVYSNELKMAAYQFDNIKQMLPHICCGFFQTKKCVHDRLKNACDASQVPDANAAQYLTDLADAMGKDMTSVVCTKHSDSSKCSQLKSISNSNLTAIVANKLNREFILMPFIRVSERMIQNDS